VIVSSEQIFERSNGINQAGCACDAEDEGFIQEGLELGVGSWENWM
jgi:hypothetical protein